MAYATCPGCGGEVPPATGSRVRIFCSQPCRQRAKDARKTERYRRDPSYRAHVLSRHEALRREAGARPMHTGTRGSCRECGTEFAGVLGKIYCSERCRRRAARRRERPREPDVIVGALTVRGPRRVRAQVSHAGGLMVYCPACGSMMGIRPDVDEVHERWCPCCGVTLTLNREEVAWVTSERLSIRQSSPAA